MYNHNVLRKKRAKLRVQTALHDLVDKVLLYTMWPNPCHMSTAEIVMSLPVYCAALNCLYTWIHEQKLLYKFLIYICGAKFVFILVWLYSVFCKHDFLPFDCDFFWAFFFFLLYQDIESEIGLNRENLIRMAMLLGSDYTEGVR